MLPLFEYYVETEAFHLKYAKGAPALVGREFHDYCELVLFLGGTSRLVSKNIQLDLTPGSLVLIPQGQFHQFIVSEPETYTRCILAFHELPELAGLIDDVMTDIKVLSDPDMRIRNMFENGIHIVRTDLSNAEKQLFVKGMILQLLVLLKHYHSHAIHTNINISPEIRSALNIIDENFQKPLSVGQIAKELHVSPSTLSHKFSRELHISLYRYISKKRLSAAHERIRNGESLTSAALNSGFHDHSCFYRLYKKYYNP